LKERYTFNKKSKNPLLNNQHQNKPQQLISYYKNAIKDPVALVRQPILASKIRDL
jgi:hypothetical protein